MADSRDRSAPAASMDMCPRQCRPPMGPTRIFKSPYNSNGTGIGATSNATIESNFTLTSATDVELNVSVNYGAEGSLCRPGGCLPPSEWGLTGGNLDAWYFSGSININGPSG